MTRFGSFVKNVKRVVSFGAVVLLATSVVAENSNYKVRIHKNLISEVLNKNFPVALDHIGTNTKWNQYLTGVMVNVNEIKLRVAPREGKDWETLHSEVFFDQGQIVMEINELDIIGEGEIESNSGS